MARKSRRDTLEQYQEKVEKCQRWRQDEQLDDNWLRLSDLYRGQHFPGYMQDTGDLIAVNLAFSTINVIAPSVAVNYPKVVVQANKPEDAKRAMFVEAVVNHLWRHHDFRTPFRRAVKDFLIFGHGWLKVGWKFVEQEQSIGELAREEMINSAMAEIDQIAIESFMEGVEPPSFDDVVASIPSTEMRIVEDQPFVERISVYDVYVDPAATCMEDARWIAQRIVRPLEEVEKDRRYKPSARKKLIANYSRDIYNENPNDDKVEYLEDQVVLWEYYDIMANTLSVYADGADEFLVDPVAMPYAYGHPFVMLRNYDIPDHFYPMGDLEAIEPLQLELDKTRSQLMNDRKRYARKYLYHERSFGPAGREALESEDDGRFVPVIDENKPLDQVVMPLPQVPLSAEIYNYSNIIANDINTVSGISEYARGAMPEIRRTATEASIIADAANARAADKLAIIEISIAQVAKRVVQLLQQFMTGEAMARVADAGGEDLFIPYGREEIVGEYDFDVQAGSTQPMNDTIRRQQAVSLLNAVAPLVGTVIDPAALARHVLEDGFGVKDPEKFLMGQAPQPQPGQEPGGGPVPPQGAPMPPGMGGAPVPQAPEGAFAPTGGVPPELLAQLQGQMGMQLPSL